MPCFISLTRLVNEYALLNVSNDLYHLTTCDYSNLTFMAKLVYASFSLCLLQTLSFIFLYATCSFVMFLLSLIEQTFIQQTYIFTAKNMVA